MSTGNECLFIQVAASKWYYVLEHYNAPKNSWDWREHASAYGPFATEDAAHTHLHDNHANPGGSSTCELPDGKTSLDLDDDPTLKRLIDQAEPARRHVRRYRW